MGRFKDLHIDQLNLEGAWIDLLAALFEKKGFVVVTRADPLRPRPAPDLAIEGDGEAIIVELKLHRSERVPLALVRNAFAQLDRTIEVTRARRGILIIPQRLVESHYVLVQRGPHELWGLDRLIDEARAFPEITANLAELLRALRVGAERPPEGPSDIAELVETPAELPPLGAGTALAEELEALPPGKKSGAAQKFEKLCEQALRLLFDKDFLGWRSQSDIEQGFQRVDVIARLQPTQSAFWSTLAVDFRTRYVVFEFKNYTDPITQDQVYTTEKYLFTSALRSVAIIIARKGAVESAERAMRGALREQALIRKVDDLLMAIGR